MKGLQAHVAEAIQRDQEGGCAGILTAEEIVALEWAICPGFDDRLASEHRITLSGLLHQLGHARMLIHAAMNRIDTYYLHCADVSIAAYDEWLAVRMSATGERG